MKVLRCADRLWDLPQGHRTSRTLSELDPESPTAGVSSCCLIFPWRPYTGDRDHVEHVHSEFTALSSYLPHLLTPRSPLPPHSPAAGIPQNRSLHSILKAHRYHLGLRREFPEGAGQRRGALWVSGGVPTPTMGLEDLWIVNGFFFKLKNPKLGKAMCCPAVSGDLSRHAAFVASSALPNGLSRRRHLSHKLTHPEV